MTIYKREFLSAHTIHWLNAWRFSFFSPHKDSLRIFDLHIFDSFLKPIIYPGAAEEMQLHCFICFPAPSTSAQSDCEVCSQIINSMCCPQLSTSYLWNQNRCFRAAQGEDPAANVLTEVVARRQLCCLFEHLSHLLLHSQHNPDNCHQLLRLHNHITRNIAFKAD